VILDTAEFALDEGQYRLNIAGVDEEDNTTGICGCNCTSCSKMHNIETKARFAGYDQIPLKGSEESPGVLSDHQYLICSQTIPVSWGHIAI